MGAIGRKLIAKMGLCFSHFLEEFVFTTSLGLFVISYLTLFLGAVRLLYPLSAYILLLLLILGLFPEIKGILFSLKKNLGEQKNTSREFFPSFLFLVMGLTLFLAFLNCFTPPLSYDTVAYHLGVPKTYIKAGGIIPLPYHVYSNFPFTMEMLYTFSLLTLGENLAKMMHWLAGILTVGAIYSLGRKYYNPKIGLLSAAIFLNIPWVSKLLTLNYNDLGLCLFIFLSLFSFLNWLQDNKKEWLILAGIFTGVSIGTKYTGIIFGFFFILMAISSENIARRRGMKHSLRLLGLYSLCSLVIASPWFIKNSLLTGNPVFPFFFNLLGGGNWGSYEAQRFIRVHSLGSISPFNFFHRLWQLGLDCLMGWIFVLFLPFIVFLKKLNLPTKIFLIYFTYCYLTWFFFTYQEGRFILPAYTVLSLIGGYLILNLPKLTLPFRGIKLTSSASEEEMNRGKKIFVFTLTGFLLILNLHQFIAYTAFNDPFDVFSGRKERETYLLEKVYYYPALRFMNKKLPPEAKILFIGDNRTYYCDKEVISNSPLDKDIIVELVRSSQDSEEVAEKLKKMGITHIYYSISEIKRVKETYSCLDWKTKKESDIFKNLLDNYTEKIFSDNRGCVVHELKWKKS